MFIPFFTRPERRSTKSLLRRKGGGGGGGGGRGGGGGGRSSGGAVKGSSSSSGTKSSTSSGGSNGPSLSISSGGKGFKASPSSGGGGQKSVVPANQPFAGREVGGGTRSQVYGTSTYGSGYPGQAGRGVQGRGFPFVFYPIVFAAPVGAGGGGYYLYREEEYGRADNSSRPGGPLRQVAFSSANSTFHIVSDNTTVTWLQTAVNSSCHNLNNFTVSAVLSYNSSQSPYPRPEQAIQYYRASSVVLTLDGYNNTAALGANETAPPLPLPSNVDQKLLSCINQTVGSNVPLVGAAPPSYTPSALVLLFVAWTMWGLGSL